MNGDTDEAGDIDADPKHVLMSASRFLLILLILGFICSVSTETLFESI